MPCSIIRNESTNEIQLVLKSDGSPSNLYPALVEEFKDKEQALLEYQKIFLPFFKDFTDEPTFDEYKNVLDTDTNIQYAAFEKVTEKAKKLTITDSGYKINNNDIERVSTLVKNYIKNLYRGFQDSNNNELNNVLMRTKGTLLHKYNELIMYDLISGTTPNYKEIREKVKVEIKDRIEKEFKQINRTVEDNFYNLDNGFSEDYTNYYGETQKSDYYKNFFDDLVKGLQLIKNEIDYNAKLYGGKPPVILLEQSFTNEDEDLAGTADLLVIYGDGSVAIYDYKFIDFKYKYNKQLQQFEHEDNIAQYKYDHYNYQIPKYAEMLKSIGINKLRQMRIIPIGLSLSWDKAKKENTGKGMAVLDVRTDNKQNFKSHLEPIAVRGEQSNIKEVDKFIVEQYQRLDKLNEAYKKDWNNEGLKEEISRVRTLINNLLVYGDAEQLVGNISATIKSTMLNMSKMDFKTLNSALETLKSYESIQKFVTLLNIYNPQNSELGVKQAILFRDLNEAINQLQNTMFAKISEISRFSEQELADFVEENNIFDVFTSFSENTNPIIVTLRDVITEAMNKVKMSNEQFIKEAEKWDKKLGENKQQIFDSLIQIREVKYYDKNKEEQIKTVKELIFKYKKEKTENDELATVSQDFEYFKNNYEIANEDLYKKDYERRKSQYLKTLLLTYAEDSTELKDKLNRWEVKNNLYISNDAWYQKSNRRWLKPTQTYANEMYNEDYGKLSDEAKEFYNWYQSKLFEFEFKVNRKLGGRFIPEIHKDLIDTIGNGGIISAFKTGLSDLVESVKIYSDFDDAYTGTEQRVPVFYTKPIDDVNDKSNSLLRSLTLFGVMANNHYNMKKIEETTKTLRSLLALQPTVQTDEKGKWIMNKLTNELKLTEVGDKLKQFDTFVNYYVYGKKIQSKDYIFTYEKENEKGEKEEVGVSFNKIALKTISYLSVKQLSLNLLSSGAGFVGASLNSLMQASKGRYYNLDQIKSALLMQSSNDKKANFIIDTFRIEDDNWEYKKANSFAETWVQRNATFDKFYILQAKGDEFIANNILLAMTKNYGIDETGQVKRLELLPENTKSIFDTIEENKLNLTAAQFLEFKRIAGNVIKKTKGTNTQTDIAPIQTLVAGRAIMQFRNWIQPMLIERFGSLKYNYEVNEFELGRYRVFADQFFKKDIKTMSANIINLLYDLGFGFFGSGIKSYNEQIAKTSFEKYLKQNPNSQIARMIASGKITKKQALQEFKNLQQGQLKAMLNELRILSMTALLLLLVNGDYDDDDKPDYKKYSALAAMKSLMERVHNEVTFFMLPTSVNEILKSPIPVFNMLSTVVNLSSNTVDEALDEVFGKEVTIKGKKRKERELPDKTGKLYYTKQLFPVVNALSEQIEWLFDE